MTRIDEERIDEMLPCPFCGSTDIDAEGWGTTGGICGPACNNCQASVGSALQSTAENIEAWNRRAAALELKELRAQGGVRVALKPLEWLQDDANEWGAGSLFGHYGVVREDVDLFSAEGPQGHLSLHNSLEEAKAAAFADYRTRILSALEIINE